MKCKHNNNYMQGEFELSDDISYHHGYPPKELPTLELVRTFFQCTDCNKDLNATSIEYICPDCGGFLWYKTDNTIYRKEFAESKEFTTFWDYSFALPQIKKGILNG